MTQQPDRLPHRGGIGLKPEHYRAVHETAAEGLWVEVHPENYMVPGGPRLAWLEAIRQDRALSFHGVGASLGGTDPLDKDHLDALCALVRRFEPESVSEHATWSAHAGHYLADLLPLPRTGEALDRLCSQIDAFQSVIGQPILVENPSVYLPLKAEMDEPDFLGEVSRRTGCGLLLDVNNVYVSARNVGFDPVAYLRGVAWDRVGEIHVAGHAPDPAHGDDLLIDTHGAPVVEPVWTLLEEALAFAGPKPVLLERDADIPPFETLMAERDRADALVRAAMDNTAAPRHARA